MSAFDLRGAVREFHETYGHPVRDQPTLEVPTDELRLGLELIGEELGELTYAIAQLDLIETADALGDLLWVVQSLAVRLGVDTDRVLKEIQESNRSKLGSDGKPVVRDDGKILKGPNFVEPNIARALDYDYEYVEDRFVDPEIDYVLAPSGGVAKLYIPTEYPGLAQCRVVTPLSVRRFNGNFPVRDVYVMRGILVGSDWPELEKTLREIQAPLRGRLLAIDC